LKKARVSTVVAEEHKHSRSRSSEKPALNNFQVRGTVSPTLKIPRIVKPHFYTASRLLGQTD
jgi:hypothetical protein